MSTDHLDGETSISAEITDTGVKAAAKSRTVSSLDRLVGGVADVGSAWLEGVAVRRRAKTDGEKKLIEATAKFGLEKFGSDDDFARRAFETHFRKIAQHQVNKDAVVADALEELRREPPTDTDATSGPTELSDDFMSRFESYAEAATTDELRAKWAKVLAAEIRKPDTFSGKVLRVIDELDSETALLFERISAHHISGAIFKSTLGEISFMSTAKLVSADLLTEPGMGQLWNPKDISDSSGVPLWLYTFGDYAIAVCKSDHLPDYSAPDSILVENDGKPAIPVYVLTPVGTAIASIMPDNRHNLMRDALHRFARAAPFSEIRLYKMNGAPGELSAIETIPATKFEAKDTS